MLTRGEYASAYTDGRNQGRTWAGPMSVEKMIAVHAGLSLNPYPLELGRPDPPPKSLLEDDPRLKAYAETILGPELAKALTSGPGAVFMLSPDKKDEALVWLSGWNDGVDDARREMADYGWLAMADEKPPSSTTRPKRRANTIRKKKS
jgi:hypothetical protein